MGIPTNTYDQLISFMDEYEPNLSADEKHDRVMSEIERVGGLMYYVTLSEFKLRDISAEMRVKTPAKYFKKYEHARIFQLRSIINQYNDKESDMINFYSDVVINKIREDLKLLCDEYPEYVM